MVALSIEVEPLTLELSGLRFVTALLAPRAHDVYVVGAAPWPAEAVEHVHQLRVATRRLREALAFVEPLCPRRAHRRANRRARELGRILGARRTIDVLKEDLAAHFVEQGMTPGHAPTFLAKLDALGDAAMDRIRSELPPERLLRDGLKLLELVLRVKDTTTTLGALAAPHLARRIAEVEPLVAIIDERSEVEQHHELRIALKHLRYAAEILRAPMPERIDVEETITPLKKVQDALGTLNDAQELGALARAHREEAETLDLPTGSLAALDALVLDLGALATTRYEAARALVHDLVPPVLGRLRALT